MTSGKDAQDSVKPRLVVAPMMGWTDRHCRVFHRLLAPEVWLFTEMVPLGAVLWNPDCELLKFDARERPLVLQVGGSDPVGLAEAARLAHARGFDEINLNVGCPSPRVRAGGFGAVLMGSPGDVAAAIAAMKQATQLPVSIKCRLGIDDQNPDVTLPPFLQRCIDAGVDRIYLHARKALLKGLNPAANREVPPLDATQVYAMKRRWPHVPFVYNGGISTIEQAKTHLLHTDGIMVGRGAYRTPQLLVALHALVAQRSAPPSCLSDAIYRYATYAADQIASGVDLSRVCRPVLGLFRGQRGAKAFRRHLTQNVHNANADIFLEALSRVSLPKPETRHVAYSPIDSEVV